MAQVTTTSNGINLREWIIILTLPAVAAFMPACSTQPASHGTAKVHQVLNKTSLPEKILMVHGEKEDAATYQGQAGYLPGNPKLGIPGTRLADGPP